MKINEVVQPSITRTVAQLNEQTGNKFSQQSLQRIVESSSEEFTEVTDFDLNALLEGKNPWL